MGDPRGFLKLQRVKEKDERPIDERVHDWTEIRVAAPPERGPRAGVALHGLRHPLLPSGLPARQPHPRVERPRLSRRAWPRRRRASTRPTTSLRSPAACARRRARRRACSTCGRAGHHQDHRAHHRRSRLRDRCPRAAATAPRRSGKRVAVVGSGPAGLAGAQQLGARGHEVVRLRARRSHSAGLLRYGIPDFKMEKGILDRAHRADARRGRDASGRASTVGGLRGEQLLATHDAVVLAMGARTPRDLPDPRPRAARASTSPWSSSRSRTGASPATTWTPREPSSRRASTSSSSAAATPVRTAWARRCGRARRASRSSS